MNTSYQPHIPEPKRDSLRCHFKKPLCIKADLIQALGTALLMLLLPFAVMATAQNATKAKDDKKLIELFTKLKNADGYTYQISMQYTIAGDTQKSPLQKRIHYVSRSSFVMYSKTENELFFLCSKGQFSVDNAQKTVYYKIFDQESERTKMKEYIELQTNTLFDSVFLNNATIAQKKTTKKNIFYKLSYPPGASIKEFSILAHLADAMPEKITYTTIQDSNPSPDAIKICQYLTMDHYQQTMPDEVQKLLLEAQDLNQFLQKKYSGYTIQKQ